MTYTNKEVLEMEESARERVDSLPCVGKPREFWIENYLDSHSLKPHDRSMHRYVHVIEHSAYQALEHKLGIAREALEFYANRETWRARVEHRALLCDFLMPEWGVIAQDSNGETARKALKEIDSI